jgi:hypothetical protein
MGYSQVSSYGSTPGVTTLKGFTWLLSSENSLSFMVTSYDKYLFMFKSVVLISWSGVGFGLVCLGLGWYGFTIYESFGLYEDLYF